MLPPLDDWEIIMLDSEAQDNAESEANEVQQLRLTLGRYDEERKLLLDEISQLKEMLKREVDQAENDKKNNMTIINDYKLVRQRLDTQLHVVWTKLDDLKVYIDCFIISNNLNFDFCSIKFQIVRTVNTFWRNQKSRQKLMKKAQKECEN